MTEPQNSEPKEQDQVVPGAPQQFVSELDAKPVNSAPPDHEVGKSDDDTDN